METKQCVGCGATKPLTAFHRGKGTYGYRGRCKECRKAETTEYYVHHSDAVKARAKAWAERYPERVRERDRLWKAQPGNADRKRAADRAWYRANKERVQEYNATPASRERNRLNAKNQKAKRKRRMGATLHRITKEEWASLKAQYAGCCAYCGKPEPNPTMDHIVPLIHGGDHSVHNIVPACSPCNLEKNDRSVVEFLRTRRTSC